MRNIIAISLLLILNASCKQNSELSIKKQQYFHQGRQLYELHCSNCHQTDGSGLGLLIPPMDSTFILHNQELIACAIKNGMKGPLEVNGKLYDREMPGNDRLTDLEIAEIMTFIRTKWVKKDSLIEISTISKSLNQCN